MRWGFYYSFTPRQAGWIVGIAFTLIGLLVILFLPSLFASSREDNRVVPFIWLLGGIFLAIGVSSLVLMIGDANLQRRNSALRKKWFWWGNLVIGVLGVLFFALPATLVLPVMLLAPTLFPPDTSSKNLFLGALFSGIGLLILLALYFIVRRKIQQRP